jgi:Ca2+/H+ antiporter
LRREQRRLKREKQRTILRQGLQQFIVVFFGLRCLIFAFVAAGFAVEYTEQKPVTIFVVNTFAIVTTAGLLGFAVDEATLHLGDTVGGLLNMSFGFVISFGERRVYAD